MPPCTPCAKQNQAVHGLLSAFSLVELSIVLVILGLLAGGILAGKSLVRASELRAVSTEYSRYVTATQAFRNKYFGLPGDITNATSFWGAAATGATCTTTPSTGQETCNGDGDGIINNTYANSNEAFRYWQQLANAGLIEGKYDGITHGSTTYSATTDNSPSSKLGNSLWHITTWGMQTGSAQFNGNYTVLYLFGAPNATDGAPEVDNLRPAEMWNIDTKLDDGNPGTGKMVSRYWGGTCNNATSAVDYTATYKLTTDSNACRIVFRQMF